MENIGSDIILAQDAINDAYRALTETGPIEDPESAYKVLLIANEVKLAVGMFTDLLADKIGDAMNDNAQPMCGKVIHRHRRASRTKWDKDGLLRVVLDTRLADENGEIIEESEKDKILRVWNLPAPRVTALRDRGIDPDDWCETEWRDGWTLSDFK